MKKRKPKTWTVWGVFRGNNLFDVWLTDGSPTWFGHDVRRMLLTEAPKPRRKRRKTR